MVKRGSANSSSDHPSITKCSKKICYMLILILNLSTWIDLNSVWIELPLIVNSAPERWTLPSTLSLVICLANIFPALVTLIRWMMGKRFSEIPFIYVIVTIGIVACCSIGLYWKRTTFIFGSERSFALIISVFSLAMLDCTSSLVFFDYMKRFKSEYLHAMFLGESLTGALPTLIALVQGVGGEAQCFEENGTSTKTPIYSEARFSVSVFFYVVTAIIAVSLIAFVLLRWTPIVKMADAQAHTKCQVQVKHQEIIEVTEMLLTTNRGNFDPSTVSLSTPNSMTRKQFRILLLLNGVSSAILYGCLPTLITYSLLPYGQKAFYYCNILFPISYPLAAVYAYWRPTQTTLRIVIGTGIGCLICVFIILIAFQSPCPIWADTLHGAVTVIFAWFLSSFILGYIRIVSGNRIKLAWGKQNGLFYFGLTGQAGFFMGAIPMYLIINIFQLLHDRLPCELYCV